MLTTRVVLAAALLAVGMEAADLSGRWEMTVTMPGREQSGRVNFVQKDGKLTGKFWFFDLNPELSGSTVKMTCRTSDSECGTFTGRVEGNSMSGEGKFQDTPLKWSARRPSVRPAGAPRRIDFEPKEFYRLFSGSIEPVLHLWPGDTVSTWTVDAGGKDRNLVARVSGGNPLTGPFYVEGAMPGDTLVVTLVRVRLNRDAAFSGDGVVGTALNPYYFKDLKNVDKFDSEWKLDRTQGFAVLKNPTERLKAYRIPLQPMMGCIGVAPGGRQSLISGNLGGWGGNLDYNQIREGATVYLPVNEPGALLFIGDGHAAQGDGELTGDALETSMDIEFTVDVKEGVNFGLQIENADFMMSSGVAGSLNEALQSATTRMSKWLSTEYDLNSAEAGIVMGSSAKYDIAEVVDPQYHVVCKLPKTALAGLRKVETSEAK